MTSAIEKLKPLLDRFWKLRHEMTWIVIGQFIGFVGGFIGIKVLTNMMGPKGYGQLALGLTIAGLLNMFVYGPVSNVVARFFIVYRERSQLHIFFASLKKAHKLLAITISLSAVLAGWSAGFLFGGEWALIVILSSLYGVASGINVSYISLQSAIRQRKIVALHQGADVWLRIGISIILLLLFSSSGYFALLGYLLGTLLVTLSQGIFALKNVEIHTNWLCHKPDLAGEKSACREFRDYGAPFVIFSGFAAISMYADRWVLLGLYDQNAVGIYAAIFQIAASPVNIFFSFVNQMMVPILFERAGDMTTGVQAENSSRLVRQTVLLSSLAMLVITATAYFFSEPLVRMFTNKAFAQQSAVLWLSVIGLGIFNIGQLFSLKGMYFNRPRIYFWPKGLQAASFLVSAYLFAGTFGIPGVALAGCFSSFVYLVTVLYCNKKIVQLSH